MRDLFLQVTLSIIVLILTIISTTASIRFVQRLLWEGFGGIGIPPTLLFLFYAGTGISILISFKQYYYKIKNIYILSLIFLFINSISVFVMTFLLLKGLIYFIE